MSVLTEYFARFTTHNLINTIEPEDFENKLKGNIGKVDAEIEGYSKEELERQRDLSIKFHWGHDHDFSTFKLDGRMGNRHIALLEKFLMLFPISIQSFKGISVLDVGC